MKDARYLGKGIRQIAERLGVVLSLTRENTEHRVLAAAAGTLNESKEVPVIKKNQKSGK
jgi:hypothetical protein